VPRTALSMPLSDRETSDRATPSRDGTALLRQGETCIRTAAPLRERTLSGIAVGLGGHGDVPPKERGEVALVRTPHLGADLDEGQVSVGQQPLGPLDPASAYVLVGRQPGDVLEQVRKMGRAHLRRGGERGQGQRLI
jgi:hypothetical protein